MMNQIKSIVTKDRNLNLLLFICSFGIYFFYFHHIFLNPNSILSSITLDTLKNYYTFVYHITNDEQWLHFSGMNFPYGEHVVYTDCQPVLSNLLKMFSFTHPYVIGILHTLLFLSFIITPLILNKLFRLLSLDKFSAFFSALAVTLLSPQYLKINAGHHALAYGSIIPLSILLLFLYLKEKTRVGFFKLLFYHLFLFFLHPYLGLSVSLFALFTLGFYELLFSNGLSRIKNLALTLLVSIGPILCFQLFMALSDHHLDRTTEPYGAAVMLENIDGLMAPIFGPFKSMMENLFPNKTQHFEGHSYLGFFSIVMTLVLILFLPFYFRKLKLSKEMLVLMLSGMILLAISFGLHTFILKRLQIESAALNQFRAACRFAWFFYYLLPLIVVPLLYNTFKIIISPYKNNSLLGVLALVFFTFNLIEANALFTLDQSVFWKFRNIFNKNQLNTEERRVLSKLSSDNVQAIIPLPLFYGGSEMYDRIGFNNSMIPAMLYSFHSGLPIISSLMSRTSISETENGIELLNSYKFNRSVVSLLNGKPFFVLKTNDPLLPDEERLLSKTKFFDGNDTLQAGFISEGDLLSRKFNLSESVQIKKKVSAPDSNLVMYIPFENKKPFIVANMSEYATVYVLDSNQIKSGMYVVSFHYHYTKKTYYSVACNLIITKAKAKDYIWEQNLPIRFLSGFYTGFGVFEYNIHLDKNCRYEFIMKGTVDKDYRISNFMLRPSTSNVYVVKQKGDTLINNFSKQ